MCGLLALPFFISAKPRLKQDPEPPESLRYNQLRDPQLTYRAFNMARSHHIPQQAFFPGPWVHVARLIRHEVSGEHAITGTVIACN